MGLIKKISNDDGILGIWKMTEKTSELEKNIKLSNSDNRIFSECTAERRKKEFLATRILLKKLINKTVQINYNSGGKPYLKNSDKNISISHSAQFVTVFLSDKKIGIDIENTTRNISRIANRFLSENEKIHIGTTKNPEQTTFIYWSAKESIFKCTSNQNIQFNQQIIIDNFCVGSEGSFTGMLQVNKQISTYKLNYFFIENNVLVYCVEQEN